MIFRADLHMHTTASDGDDPRAIAATIATSDLDVFAVTDHNRLDGGFFAVRDELANILDGTGRQILALLGAEMTVIFRGIQYHIGVIMEGNHWNPQSLPDAPPRGTDIGLLKDYRAAHPSIAIFEHPTLHDKTPADLETTQALMSSGLVDGVEIVNGTVLSNGTTGYHVTQTGFEQFLAAKQRIGPRLAAIGASDAHIAEAIASAYTKYEARDPSDLFTAVREGRTNAAAVQEKVRGRVNSLARKVPGIGRYIAHAL